MRRAWKAGALLAAVALGAGAAVAVASVPDGNGAIHACGLSKPSGGSKGSKGSLLPALARRSPQLRELRIEERPLGRVGRP